MIRQREDPPVLPGDGQVLLGRSSLCRSAFIAALAFVGRISGDAATARADQPRPTRPVAALVGRSRGDISVNRKELNPESSAIQEHDCMLDAGGNRLSRTGFEDDIDPWCGGRSKAEPSRRDANAAPRSTCQAVSPPKTRGKGCLGPHWRGASGAHCARKLGSVAQRAIERHAEAIGPPIGAHHPWPVLKRRTVTNMLIMPAGEFGDPLALVVLVVAADRAFHTPSLNLKRGW